MRILIYSPSNLRAVDQQSQAELLLSLGHQIFLLTWAPPGVLHENIERLGGKAYSSSHVTGRSVIYFIRQAIYLAAFCRKHKIQAVFSHLQSNAVVAGLARPFTKARFFYVRHNADYFHLRTSKKEKFINRLANRLSPAIIAISDNVENALLKEKVRSQKILRINLCYNFDQYDSERKQDPAMIRNRFSTDYLLICIARLDPLKRHLETFSVVESLNKQGYDCKLVCIGNGDKDRLQEWIVSHGMQNSIFLEGFVTNVFDYIEASDLVILLSYSEASSHAVKEAGICKRPAIVCEDVGDFGEYIQNGVNGFLVGKENPEKETIEILKDLIKNKEKGRLIGMELNKTIQASFGLENVRKKYQQLLN